MLRPARGRPLIPGLELVSGQLRATLEGHGLQEVPVEPGALFDPTFHEAIMAQASDDTRKAR